MLRDMTLLDSSRAPGRRRADSGFNERRADNGSGERRATAAGGRQPGRDGNRQETPPNRARGDQTGGPAGIGSVTGDTPDQRATRPISGRHARSAGDTPDRPHACPARSRLQRRRRSRDRTPATYAAKAETAGCTGAPATGPDMRSGPRTAGRHRRRGGLEARRRTGRVARPARRPHDAAHSDSAAEAARPTSRGGPGSRSTTVRRRPSGVARGGYLLTLLCPCTSEAAASDRQGMWCLSWERGHLARLNNGEPPAHCGLEARAPKKSQKLGSTVKMTAPQDV